MRSKSQRPLKRARLVKPKLSSTARVRRILENSEERKYFETAGGGADVAAAGTVLPLNEIAEGSDFNQRIGRRVRNKYLAADIGITISAAQVLAGATHYGTWHLVLDRQPNNATPTFATIFDTTISTNTFAYKNSQAYERRFRLLKSERFAIGTATTGQNYRVTAHIDFEKMPASDQTTQWLGSTGIQPTTNALYLVYVSDETAMSQVLLNWTTRIVYVDM